MKKIYTLFTIVAFLLCYSGSSFGQSRSPKKPSLLLGDTESFVNSIKQQASSSNQRKAFPTIELKASPKESFKGKINFQALNEAQGNVIIGEVEGVEGSNFFIKAKQNLLEGEIVLKGLKKAFKYYSNDKGEAFVQEVDINSIVCIDYRNAPTLSSVQRTMEAAALAAIDLQSLPGAAGCVLLDYDGQYVSGTRWNSGNPINAAPSGMSDAQIQEAWEIVSEDFKPFNVNITTSEAVFNTYPKNRRMRCIITPTNTAAPGSGGVAYIGSFSWNDDTPCWVFITSAKASGEASSHEVGHTFGLGHDGRTNPNESYFGGHGSWAPIMGVGYYKNITHWSKGEYAYANNTEDDLAKISSSTYGVGYRNDDHGNDFTTATVLKVNNGTVVASDNQGFIGRTTDVDFFSFTTGGGNVVLNFNPAARHADLDILVSLYNEGGSLIGTYNPSTLASSLNVTLAAGRYYLSVDGTGAGDPATNGYSDYGSLGFYSIAGTIPFGSGVNLPPLVSISSPANGTLFTAPANITINANASDPDGNVARVEFYNGSTKLGEDTSSPYSFLWSGVAQGAYTITARAFDNVGAQATSTSINLQVSGTNNSPAVSITAPINGTTFTAPANIAINASASDSDGTIVKVEFYNGATKLGEDTASPFSFGWSDVPAGSYTLTARAFDNGGAQTTSSPVNIQVNPIVTLPLINNAIYTIVAVHSNKVADVSGADLNNGAKVIQWPAHGGANQHWKAVSLADGYWRFINMNSGRSLEVGGMSLSNGGAIQQWDWVGHEYQQWLLESAGENKYFLVNRGSGKVMDVSGVSTADGAAIWQWGKTGATNQQWRFNLASGSPLETAEMYTPKKLSVSPNPAISDVKVSYEASVSGVVEINIYNSKGVKIHHIKEDVQKGSNEISLRLPHNVQRGLHMIVVGKEKTRLVIN